MIIIIFQLILLAYILISAGRDSDSIRMKTITVDNLLITRLKRWHRSGAITYIIVCGMLTYFLGWKILIAGVIIRIAFFDLALNKWAGFPFDLIGTTALTDQFFAKIFGQHGAVKKALAFFVLLIALNILNYLHGQ